MECYFVFSGGFGFGTCKSASMSLASESSSSSSSSRSATSLGISRAHSSMTSSLQLFTRRSFLSKLKAYKLLEITWRKRNFECVKKTWKGVNCFPSAILLTSSHSSTRDLDFGLCPPVLTKSLSLLWICKRLTSATRSTCEVAPRRLESSSILTQPSMTFNLAFFLSKAMEF